MSELQRSDDEGREAAGRPTAAPRASGAEGCCGPRAPVSPQEPASRMLEGAAPPRSVVTDITIGAATPRDDEAVRALLREGGLPDDAAADGAELLLARHGTAVVGCIGWERRGNSALFRSLVVTRPYRGIGLAHRLHEALEARVIAAGVSHAFLLTMTIQPLAEQWGFRRIERIEVPPAIRETSEFRGGCCASAVAMAKTLPQAGQASGGCGAT